MRLPCCAYPAELTLLCPKFFRAHSCCSLNFFFCAHLPCCAIILLFAYPAVPNFFFRAHITYPWGEIPHPPKGGWAPRQRYNQVNDTKIHASTQLPTITPRTSYLRVISFQFLQIPCLITFPTWKWSAGSLTRSDTKRHTPQPHTDTLRTSLKLIKIRFAADITKSKALGLIDQSLVILGSHRSRIKPSATSSITLPGSVYHSYIKRLLLPPTISSRLITQKQNQLVKTGQRGGLTHTRSLKWLKRSLLSRQELRQ